MTDGVSDILTQLAVRMGFGTLRLCLKGRPEEMDAIAVIHFALKNGIRLLDTADSYCIDDSEFHYGEHLVREAVSCWPGPKDEVLIATKVGLTRGKGRWTPNGRPDHIRTSVEDSLKALAIDRLFLLKLHTRDPNVPYADSLGALAELQQEGKVEHLGVCNATVHEIEQAQRHFTVAAVQNELSVLNRKAATEGSLAYCTSQGIPFLAHRPLGGYIRAGKLKKSGPLVTLAERRGCTVEEMALSALLSSCPDVIPLVGATRMKSLTSSFKGYEIELDVSDRTAISVHFPFAGSIEESLPTTVQSMTSSPNMQPNQGPGTQPEVVMVMGIQGAGKSELVTSYVQAGYARLNRDLIGGKLDDLVPRMEALIQAGQQRIVLDNTYPSVTSRAPVIAKARQYGIPVRCRHLQTPPNEAYANIVLRMLGRYGMCLGPQEMKAFAKVDTNLPPPIALTRWLNSFEPPSLEEGIDAVDLIPFVRRTNPQQTAKGLLLDVDGTLRVTLSGEFYPRHPDDVKLLPGRRERLQPWIDAGYQLFFVSNQSGVSSGRVAHEAVQACMLKTAQLLDLPVAEVAYCPHPARPVGCYCRKPMPGLGVYLMEKHGLAKSSLQMVGDMDSDQEFAVALGIPFHHATDFFEGPAILPGD